MNDPAKNDSVLPPEQQAIREKCYHPSGTFVEFPKQEVEQSISERFEKIVRMYPDRLAVKTKTLCLTYEDLNQAANRIARAILAQCGEGEEPVALLLEHGVDVIAAILAVLKTGKIYVPLDPTLPHARNNSILEDTRTDLIVTDTRHLSYASQIQKRQHVINIDEPAGISCAENIGSPISPDNLAYILYTSGSAGQPKGVVQNHRNLLNQIKRETNGLHICVDDRLILLRSCSAIGGVRIVLSALLNGAAVYPLNVAEQGHAELADLLLREAITIYDSTPTTFRHFVGSLIDEERFPNLRLIRLSSEPVYKQDVELYQRHFFSRDCIFVNSLGLTETTGTIRHNLIDQETQVTGSTVPVGYAVEEMEILLLDDQGHEVGLNGIGEIAVKSRYLSPGYWRRPNLTQSKFLPDPKGGDKRLYLTGDLGHLLPDGCLVHLGRKDFQVKVRGYKVDVAEIELALLALDAIKAAVVIARADRPDEQYLVAYLVTAKKPSPTISSLRRALSEVLPDYMIPSSFVMLDAMPVTPSGKVDRSALPAPDRTRPTLDAVFVRPRTQVEISLAKIWREVLHIEKIGVDDNFFDLGGNSLRLAQANHKVGEVFGREPPLMEMLAHPTVNTLAKYLTGKPAELSALQQSHDRAETRRALRARRRPSARNREDQDE